MGATVSPWKIERRGNEIWVLSGVILIARLELCGSGEGAWANARLIQSAPDLLTTLEEILPALDWAITHQPGNNLQFRECYDKASTVIQNAKGGAIHATNG